MKERFLANDIRRGAAVIGKRRFMIESVHNYKVSKFLSPTPVGYLVSLDDLVVAAVELTDVNPALYLLPDQPTDLKESITIIALAIAVLRDSANSALED